MNPLTARMAVVGATGAGKTRLAQALAKKLSVPHVELDALYWEAGWKEAPREVFRARVAAALSGPGWVTDGNYGFVRDLIWGRATALIWLDYPLARAVATGVVHAAAGSAARAAVELKPRAPGRPPGQPRFAVCVGAQEPPAPSACLSARAGAA